MSTLYFDLAQAIDVIGETKTDPCGDIRRINVEIPSLSVSDMKRLKATDRVSIYLSVSDMNRPSVSDGPICHGLYQSVCLVPNTNLILIQTHKPEAMQLDIRVCPFFIGVTWLGSTNAVPHLLGWLLFTDCLLFVPELIMDNSSAASQIMHGWSGRATSTN